MINKFMLTCLEGNIQDRLNNFYIKCIMTINLTIITIQVIVVVLNLIFRSNIFSVIFPIINTVLLLVLLISNVLIEYNYKKEKKYLKNLINGYKNITNVKDNIE